MKKFYSFLIILSLPLMMTSQRLDKYAESLMVVPAIAYQEQQVPINKVTHPAITVKINANESEYSKDWKSYMKTKYGLEGKKNSGYLSAFGVVVSEWSSDTLNLHYKTEKDGDGTRLFILAEQKGEFLSEQTHPEIISKIKASVTTQIKGFYVKYYDKYIAQQQKYYDSQVKDMEKLRKKQEKMNSDIESHNKSIQKANSNIRDSNTKVNSKDNEIKSLNSELAQNKKAVDQAQKEVDSQAAQITAKEGEYNRLNYSGALNTKEGERVIKDLGKLRKKQEKLQGNLVKASGKVTKTENAILKAEQGKSKEESKLSDLKSGSDKHQSKVDNLKSDQQQNQKEISDKQSLIDAARSNLDRLKSAKNGVTGL